MGNLSPCMHQVRMLRHWGVAGCDHYEVPHRNPSLYAEHFQASPFENIVHFKVTCDVIDVNYSLITSCGEGGRLCSQSA